MGKPNDDMDIRTEMRIALFWRHLIGDGEYVKYDPDDFVRWYEALELRGPDEIRAVKNERYATVQSGVMQGVVMRAPHPPLWIINQWLELYEQKLETGGYWAMAFCFVVLSGMCFSALQGCVNLQPMNPLILHPPPGTPTTAQYMAPGTYSNGNVSQGMTTFSPTTAPQAVPTATGPQSNGIAGAATGMVSPTGPTGGQNIGASAGVQSSSPP